MGSNTPKQFLLLNQKPILMHTFEAFIKADPQFNFVLVLHPNYWDEWSALCEIHNFQHPHKITSGGQTRFHSVLNGLNEIESIDGIVAVHDAARPLISPELINRCFNNVIEKGSTVPVINMTDSVRQITESGNEIIDRKLIKKVQTPQCFKLDLLKQAYEQTYNPIFTDDASVVEAGSLDQIHLVVGEERNLKVTHQLDLILAEALLKD